MSDRRFDPRHVGPSEDEQRLVIDWGDGHHSEYWPRDLRLACPCAGCVDEMTGQPILDPRTVPFDVYPAAIRWVGRYALGFEWSDGHDTGIYTFERLRDLCPCDECSARRSPG
jgi:ATP-binding protein involved in chromosome partitioning